MLLCGCTGEKQVRSLPVRPPEQPPANLPVSLHQRNWLGPKKQGSCVHASLVNHMRWLNMPEMAERWRSTYGDGEWDDQLRRRLNAANLDYVYTNRSDPRFLDWCSQTRRGAICWWKPSHCCTFVGWVTGKDGNEYAAILDNNYPGKYEYTPREQFIRLWAGYGGFALSLVNEPASSVTYKSYEVVR
jgi:hypothetical protein